ncbi:hypothetical protein BBJ28_00021644, partial [Nothophytophthora sp. Chile5]
GAFIAANQELYSSDTDPDCGLTIYDDAERSALPASTLTYSGFTHTGPCEVWCDDTKVLFDYDCQTTYPDIPATMAYDESLCADANRLTIYWIGLHGDPWQVYTDCVWLEGGSGSGSAPAAVGEGASTTTSSNSTTTTTATTAPTTTTATTTATTAPTATTAAPTTTTTAPAATTATTTTTTAPTATTAASSTAGEAETEAPAATTATTTTEAPVAETTDAPAATTATAEKCNRRVRN